MTILRIIRLFKNTVADYSTDIKRKPPWNVLFFGSDVFSLYSLELLHKELLKRSLVNGLEVVTTVKRQGNHVQKFATKENLIVHKWPHSVDVNKYDVGIVVSFGHLLPESVINAFPYGILNVHASLLPRWRGAAPIIHAIAHGDTETGITIMRIKPNHFDIGEIILQKKIEIPSLIRMPQLHKNLGEIGSSCLISILKELPEALSRATPQPKIGVTFAPKVTPEFAVIKWETMSSTEICNLDRAICGVLVPTCFWKNTRVKLFQIKEFVGVKILENTFDHVLSPGHVMYDKLSKTLRILCASKTFISVGKVGVLGKKPMNATDFYNGFISKQSMNEWYFT